KLGLPLHTSKISTFKIADNGNAASLGTMTIHTIIGPIQSPLTYHVANNLSHPVIIGYPQLKALGAVIHTDRNVIHFPSANSSGVSGVSGVSMVSSLRPPAQNKAYVEVRGPLSSVVFISTPPELAAEKLLSVASGLVRFNKDGFATITLANLSNWVP
ncbi:hypothetical protein A0J61_11599, partial [Choanephora cucurbitarum]